MKREDWQKAYAPQGNMLDIRVNSVLASLSEEPERSMNMKKRFWVIALAAVLALASAVALAAGLAFSQQADVMSVARKALAEQYGFTAEMEAFFRPQVQEDGKTVLFSGWDTGFDERIGVYTVVVNGKTAKASWSYDGEEIGADTTSGIWDTALLAEAIARKASGEEWAQILYPPEMLAVSVSTDEAADIAQEAVLAQYGETALEDFGEPEVVVFYNNPQETKEAGSAIKFYQVRYYGGRDASLMEMYTVKLQASDGEIIECRYVSEEVEPVTDASGEITQETGEDPAAQEAKARARIAPEEAIELAKDAAAQAYGLSAAQRDALDWIEEHEPQMYGMDGDTPVMTVWLWLWQQTGDNAPFTQGNGLYTVTINAETGVIEGVYYDSTLSGNG